MKYITILIIITGTFGSSYSQENGYSFRNKLGIYPTINFVPSLPQGDFKSSYPKNFLLGFNFDAVFIPIKKYPVWQPGAQIEINFTTTDRDTWKGIEVNSNGAFIKLNLINRFRMDNGGALDPFLELAFGVNFSSTSTTYEIIDEATFFEEFFLDQSDEVETVSVKDHNDSAMNLGIGAGVFIADIVVLQVKLNYSPEIEFVTKENITVINDEIDYVPSRSMITTLSLSIGFSLQKIMNME